MRKISDTIARLAAARAQQSLLNGHQGGDRLSDFTAFGSNPGALLAKTYIPDNLPDNAPLVVVLHGCTQTASAYDHGSGWSQLADREGFAVLYPEQQRANNAGLCFNWFAPGDVKRDSGEALSIRQMIDAVAAKHGIDRKRIFVTGLSAGGAMTSAMLAAYPEVFAGGAIIAGLPHGVASTIPEAFDRMRGHGGPSVPELQKLLRAASSHKGPWPTLSVWHGTADRTVASSNADAIIGQWLAVHGLGVEPQRSETVDGHPRRVWRDAKGQDVIEDYRLAEMGHGTPLATAGHDPLGAVGPFMLDVGISSTLHIARFWGVAKSGKAGAAKIKVGKTKNGTAPDARPRAVSTVLAGNSGKARAVRPDATPEKAAVHAPHSAAGIKKTIEDALRAAGLMR